MIRVRRVTGEELAAIPVEELSDVASLQRWLRAKHGMPVSLQQLLHDNRKLEDHDMLGAPMELQLILATTAQDTEAKDELYEAASAGEVEVVRILLQSGVGPNVRKHSLTALMSASLNGHVEVVRLLLEGGAAINSTDGMGHTALIRASEQGHAEVVHLLLGGRAAHDSKTSFGDTALIRASEGGHADVVRLLLQGGADKNVRGMFDDTALISAAGHGRVEVARVLLEAGAATHMTNEYGDTALKAALVKGHPEVVRLLLKDVFEGVEDGRTAFLDRAHALAVLGGAKVLDFLYH